MPIAAGQTVLFLGDSITHAHRRPEEVHDCYRLGCGYVNSVAAELTAAHPAAAYHFDNRGHCGDTVRHLCDRWPTDASAAAVSILVGINDAKAADADAERFGADYARLLERIHARLPDARLMLLEPFGVAVRPHPTVEIISAGQLARLARLRPIVREVAAAAGATFVPLQDLFADAASTLDGIHPSAAGHWRVARGWVAAGRRAGWFPAAGDDT